MGAHHEAHGGCFWAGKKFIKDFDGMCRGISAVGLFSNCIQFGLVLDVRVSYARPRLTTSSFRL